MTEPVFTFAAIIAVYSLLLFLSYRPLTRSGVRLFRLTTPIETTTAEERSRGEVSFTIRRERRFGVTRNGFLLLAIFGYLGFAVAFVILSRSHHL